MNRDSRMATPSADLHADIMVETVPHDRFVSVAICNGDNQRLLSLWFNDPESAATLARACDEATRLLVQMRLADQQDAADAQRDAGEGR